MSIVYHESSKIFHLYNQTISYIMMVLPNGHMGQLYYGKKIRDKEDFSYLLELAPRDMASYLYENDRTFSLGHIKLEYGTYGSGDYRHPAVEILQNDGSTYSDFQFTGYQVTSGKPKLPGLPATYTEQDGEAETLIITLKDTHTNLELHLLYTIFVEGGVIARSASISNQGDISVQVQTAMSLCLDLPDHDYEWMQFSGAWARERALHTRRLEYGIQAIDSTRGHSSHEQNPFIILKRPSADEFQGEAIGCSLIYSGNFLAQAEVESHGTTRLMIGINPFGFSWELNPGETFQTPEAVLVYSSQGLNDMSQTFHRLYRRRLARGYWRDRERPILINNWEATYFDFTGEKIIEIAKQAAELGVEMLVLDDGWFGKRDDDLAGLGDWTVNEKKLGMPLGKVAEKIRGLGMKFGIWIEPEMVCEDSDLYREHPDWAFTIPGRKPVRARYQLVLDYSRKEVVDGIFAQIAKVLDDTKADYVKMDMNRHLTDIWSKTAAEQNQGAILHRYVLGVYDFLERLHERYPDLLIEGCSGGGGRFDAGMLYYTPQIWCSDNTDAVERIKIQYGTSFAYPSCTVGSHVSAVPNHQTGRMTELATRAAVAMAGSFGYELDLNLLTEEEKEQVREQIKNYHRFEMLIRQGRYYRLTDVWQTKEYAAWEYCAPDESEALVTVITMDTQCNPATEYVKLRGLGEDKKYRVEVVGMQTGGENGQRINGTPNSVEPEYFTGAQLVHAGLPVPRLGNEYKSWQVYVKEV